MAQTTRIELQECTDTPLVCTSSEEPLNSTKQPETAVSKFNSHWLSGYNSGSNSRGRMSAHIVFVLDVNGKPLTPTTSAKARKLLNEKQALPVWNKFQQFGIQMLVDTRKNTPVTVLGVDNGTKFEGYSIVIDKENNLNVMLLLPNKKEISRKLEERKSLRRARRQRNCRRRKCRSDRKHKKGFIAPSQWVIVTSRLKIIRELFKCYPIIAVAIEDVKFNHAKHRWGKNFSTMEIGKQYLYNWIKKQGVGLKLYEGIDTFNLRNHYGYKKISTKSREIFTSHCSDSLTLSSDGYYGYYVKPGKFIVVDDTYRQVRRKLHDTQPRKGGVREKYSSGNFKRIRKGTICQFGQIVGGTKNNVLIRNSENKRIGKTIKKLGWLSHGFKVR